MRRVPFLQRHVTVLGARFPMAPMLLAGTTLVATVLGVAGARNGIGSLLALGLLQPGAVLSGQVWRLVTWTFFEPSPLGLIFAVLSLLFFGRDLASSWGPERFLLRCLGLVVSTGLVTCLIAQFLWTSLGAGSWFSAWPLVEGLILAWATQFPGSQVLVYFVLPVAGRRLVILTIAGTLLFAALGGIGVFLPNLVAIALTMAWLHGVTPRGLWLRLRARSVRFTPRRPTHLRPVERPEEPPRWLH